MPPSMSSAVVASAASIRRAVAVNFMSFGREIYGELRRSYWPSLGASLRRMAAIVVVFLVLGGFALLTRYVAIWVRDLVASAV